MKTIRLTRGKEAQVSDTDYVSISKHKWSAVFDGHNWYASKRNGSGHIRMHAFLMNPPAGEEIDHRDRNGLNNQRRNLRICSHSNNCQNRMRTYNKTSKFKGVSWKKKNNKWCAQIRVGGTVFHLGLFREPELAARAYDIAALKAFGRFALTNKKLGLI